MNMNFAPSAVAAVPTSNSKQRMILTMSFIALVLLIAFVGPASAQGLEKVNEGVQKIIDTLNIISVGVVTIAVVIAGYKIAFQAARMNDVAPILIGGILVGAAAQIAAFLIQ
ncbi:TrbC/VirB2 family protein [Aminobacter sp. MSH1]|uniref:TrbC/VirB2 family protein n=1 Tax=Aminobacter sp. MSH1 TaxID=374606 RepID=UPI001FDF016B|nr:TrbC/VirB2 family protein [Aminobacter sp. MSH1]